MRQTNPTSLNRHVDDRRRPHGSNDIRRVRASSSPPDVLAKIGQIPLCGESEQVASITKAIVRELGAHWYVYSTLRQSDLSPDRDSCKFFDGCRKDWSILYQERKWFMSDPFVEYARTSNLPILASKIKAETAGQAEMLETVKCYGFRSTMVIPTHSNMNVNERMGLLYIGCEEEESIGEPLLDKHCLSYRTLGFVLLDWWVARLRAEAMRKFKITDDEINLLQDLKRGRTPVEIAAKIGLKARAVYSRLGTIKDKLNVDRIEEAVREASISGLLG
jgi:DNA-binding CsgD family transcriptional regulator